MLLFIFVLAIVGTAIWAFLDRNRPSYNKLFYWLTVVVRYYVGFTMLSYGAVKVFKLQFPAADPFRLVQPYGESSPMGLAWTYMGYSEGYNFFTGAAEMLGGILLLFRRTTTLGAMVTFGVMGNVMAMNYSYDIPVKILSSMLVFMSVFLMAKDIRRLYHFFIVNKTAAPANIAQPPIRNRKWRVALVVIKTLLLTYYIGMGLYDSATSLKKYGDNAPKPPLYGIYNVETFVLNNDTLPPLQTDTLRWKQLVVGGYRGYTNAYLKSMSDTMRYHAWRLDTTEKKVTLFTWSDTTAKYQLAYHFPDKEHLEMRGTYKNDSVFIRMATYDLNKFLLKNRGFHWINEYPFNR
jgi:hypothetical protein